MGPVPSCGPNFLPCRCSYVCWPLIVFGFGLEFIRANAAPVIMTAIAVTVKMLFFIGGVLSDSDLHKCTGNATFVPQRNQLLAGIDCANGARRRLRSAQRFRGAREEDLESAQPPPVVGPAQVGCLHDPHTSWRVGSMRVNRAA